MYQNLETKLRVAYLADTQTQIFPETIKSWISRINSNSEIDAIIVNGDTPYHYGSLEKLTKRTILNLGNHDNTFLAMYLAEKNPYVEPIYSPQVVSINGVKVLVVPGATTYSNSGMFVNGPGNVFKIRNKEEGNRLLIELARLHYLVEQRKNQYDEIPPENRIRVEGKFEGSGYYKFEPVVEEIKAK